MKAMLYAAFNSKFKYKLLERLLSSGVRSYVIGDKVPRGILASDYTSLDIFRSLHTIPDTGNWVVDSEILEKFIDCFNDVMVASDRMSFYPVRIKYRQEYYYRILNFFLNYFADKNVEVLVLPDTPHVPWSIVLFHVATYLGIRTVFLERTNIGETIVFTSDLRYTKIPLDFVDIKKNTEYLSNASMETAMGLHGSRSKNLEVLGRISGGKLGALKSDKFGNGLKKWLLNKRVKEQSFVMTNSQSYRDYLRALSINKRRIRLLFQEYVESAHPVEPGLRYVYLPLHLQPEKTTMPLAGNYENQFLVIKLLSECLPRDVALVVKEHPRQFDYRRLISSTTRFNGWYRSIAQIANVRIAGIDESTEYLIENSVAVATCTGSTGWEALLKGKPVLLFGNIWYMEHPLCHRIDDRDTLKNAIENIMEGSLAPSGEEMKVFFDRVSRFMTIGSNHEVYSRSSRLGQEELLSITTDALRKVLNLT